MAGADLIPQVSQWIFGQEFPDGDAPIAQQVFAVITAIWGLAVFALVLALVEQVRRVLSPLEHINIVHTSPDSKRAGS
jgi:hypothetical protein